MTAINYLFPPDKIHDLPTWRFVVHFKEPPPLDVAALAQAVAGMKSAEWRIISFPFGLDGLSYDPKSQTVGIPIEVPPARRRRPGSLADYESDFWKICGHMAGAGFDGDIFYEAVDWQE